MCIDKQAIIGKINNIKLILRQLEGMLSIEKLITRSECLRHPSVDVQLRWRPGSQSEGSKRAELAARKAARSHTVCRSGDNLDEGLQILIDSLEEQ